jgi:FKBP-type peptidyl-prolyl cis-trans isomerase
MRRLFFTLIVISLLSPLAQAQRERLPPEDRGIVRERWPQAERMATGLYTQVLVPGQAGRQPKPGDEVAVLYRGYLLDGTVFDERLDPEKPFRFRLGRGLVIDGWEWGIPLMQVGEKRLLIVPFELGYGTRGRTPDIPRRATLVFEVELMAITPR